MLDGTALGRIQSFQIAGVRHDLTRAALERAWFEQQPLKIVYVDGNFVQATRVIRVLGVLMERRETRLDAIDTKDGERRHFRLDRIEQAEVVRLDAETPPATNAGKRR